MHLNLLQRLFLPGFCLLVCLSLLGCQTGPKSGVKRGVIKNVPANTPGWQVVSEDYFLMELPGDMSRKQAEGFDSMVGKYKSSTMELHFDAKDALVYEARRARVRLAQMQKEFKPNTDIPEGGKGVIEVNGRLAYLQHDQNTKWKALGYPFENALQIFFPDPSGGSLSVLLVYKSRDQMADAVKILRSIRFRR